MKKGNKKVSLWGKLITKDILVRGWHLARLDTREDFAEDLFSTDIYGLDLDQRIKETTNRIKTGTYQPRPLMRLEVPKGSLGFRPGSIIQIQDRVVLSAIVLLMVEKVDKLLPDAVYSWRLKNPVPKKGPIFEETDITKLPYLKKKTIRKRFDPFIPWYQLWPGFDKISRQAYIDEGYRFLATSDIAAYFENIQLPILRDLLLQLFPNDPRLINLLFSFLEAWTYKTSDGRVHQRGIPQGNFISSFLGNLFLLPLDKMFVEFEKKYAAKYFRYMDDVRIFTKRIEDARLSIFMMDRQLRQLHLNVQTAKTKILDHKLGEISKTFSDDRVDDLSEIIEEIEKKYKNGNIPKKIKAKYLTRLGEIAKKDIPGQQKLIGARRPLSGLSLRAFARWIYAHSRLGSDKYIDRLLKELNINPEYKLTKKLINTTKLFPRKAKIEGSILQFLKSENNIFPHQEAECIRAIRYLSHIHDKTISHCLDRLFDESQSTYVRMQCAYLLSRTNVDLKSLKKLHKLFEQEKNPYVQVALSTILVQIRRNNSEFIQQIVFHPNEKVCDIGKFYRNIKNDIPIAKDRLKHIFKSEADWLLCDNMAFIHLMAASNESKIKTALVGAIKMPRMNHPVCGLRDILKDIYTRTKESLR